MSWCSTPVPPPNRMERGIRFLSQDADALDAFRVANRAVAAALSRRLAREGVTEPTAARTPHAARSVSTRTPRKASPPPFRWRVAPGAGRTSPRIRSRCCRTRITRRNCASPVPTGSATSRATRRCPSSPWTSRSTVACLPLWSPRWTNSPRYRGWASPVRSWAAPTAMTRADSTVPPSRAAATG